MVLWLASLAHPVPSVVAWPRRSKAPLLAFRRDRRRGDGQREALAPVKSNPSNLGPAQCWPLSPSLQGGTQSWQHLVAPCLAGPEVRERAIPREVCGSHHTHTPCDDPVSRNTLSLCATCLELAREREKQRPKSRKTQSGERVPQVCCVGGGEN